MLCVGYEKDLCKNRLDRPVKDTALSSLESFEYRNCTMIKNGGDVGSNPAGSIQLKIYF